MIDELKIIKYGIVALLAVICFYSCTTRDEGAREIKEKNVSPSKKYTVVIQQMKFTPAALTINEGDTVTWVNQDIVDHNVTEEINKEWASGNLPRGNSWNMIVKKSASYFCTIHPVMKGSLTVR
jgi:plastocyanin